MGGPASWAEGDPRLSYLEAELGRLSGLRQRLADTELLFDLAESENDEPTRGEAAGELAALKTEINQSRCGRCLPANTTPGRH